MSQVNQSAPSQSNRRYGRRLPLSGAARIECRKGGLGLGPNITQSAVNISETGVCLLLKVTLDKGKEAEIQITGPGIPRALRRLARVSWVHPLGDGTCCVGLRFDSPLPYSEMQKVTKAFR